MDRFQIQTADVGQLFKVKIRHDNSAMISSDWFLDRIEVKDVGREKSIFICERWLSKSKEDKLIERNLFEKSYHESKSSGQKYLSLKPENLKEKNIKNRLTCNLKILNYNYNLGVIVIKILNPKP